MRPALAAVLAVLLAGGLAACGPTEDPEPTSQQTTTSVEIPMSGQQVRQAAEAEQPVTEAKLCEVAALLYPDLDELAAERPRWLGGGTAACSWDLSSLSYIADFVLLSVESPCHG